MYMCTYIIYQKALQRLTNEEEQVFFFFMNHQMKSLLINQELQMQIKDNVMQGCINKIRNFCYIKFYIFGCISKMHMKVHLEFNIIFVFLFNIDNVCWQER